MHIPRIVGMCVWELVIYIIHTFLMDPFNPWGMLCAVSAVLLEEAFRYVVASVVRGDVVAYRFSISVHTARRRKFYYIENDQLIKANGKNCARSRLGICEKVCQNEDELLQQGAVCKSPRVSRL